MGPIDTGSDALVDRIYDIVVAPDRLEELVDAWEARLNGSGGARFEALADPGLLDHVLRAERVLHEFHAFRDAKCDAPAAWVDATRSAAMIVNQSNVIVAANDKARHALSIEPGADLAALPLAPVDLAALADMLSDVSGPDRRSRIVLLRTMTDGVSFLVSIVRSADGNANHTGLVTSLLSWPPSLSSLLKDSFALTDMEVTVLKDVVLGHSVKSIAGRYGRSERTIRSHVQAVLDKTATNSQIELVRVILGLLDAVRESPFASPCRHLAKGPAAIPFETLVVDGRNLDYLVIGDRAGAAFLYLPSDMGFTRLPRSAEDWLKAQGLKMIVPVRAGYGRSSPLPRNRDAFEVAIGDMLELLDAMGADRLPVLSLADDFHLAVSLAIAAPQRVTGIVALGPVMPATERKHFQRMPKWTRFVLANAHHAPRVLPFIGLALFQLGRQLGPKKLLRMILSESKADLALLNDDEIHSALVRGSEIAVGPGVSAHTAWVAGAISNYATGWHEKLRDCAVPMVIFAGSQDPFAPIETTREFAAGNANIELRELADYGQLLFPIWRQFLDEIERRVIR